MSAPRGKKPKKPKSCCERERRAIARMMDKEARVEMRNAGICSNVGDHHSVSFHRAMSNAFRDAARLIRERGGR
jgi:hypothetical protein